MIFMCDVVRTMSAFQLTEESMNGVPQRQFLPPRQLMVPASSPSFLSRTFISPIGRGRMMLERHERTAGEVNRPGPITCGMFLCRLCFTLHYIM